MELLARALRSGSVHQCQFLWLPFLLQDASTAYCLATLCNHFLLWRGLFVQRIPWQFWLLGPLCYSLGSQRWLYFSPHGFAAQVLLLYLHDVQVFLCRILASLQRKLLFTCLYIWVLFLVDKMSFHLHWDQGCSLHKWNLYWFHGQHRSKLRESSGLV